VSRITLRLNRYPQEALQNAGIGVDTTPVVTKPECYNREVKRLKIRARKAYNMIKLGEFLQADLKCLSGQLLAEKKDIFTAGITEWM